MATSIFFNGKLSRVPGAPVAVDASGLASVGLGASGIVAIVGACEGGRPVSAVTNPSDDFPRAKNPEGARKITLAGDLHEAAQMAFSPSRDPDIAAGAAEVVMARVNPATQSSVNLKNALGQNAILAKSKDWGVKQNLLTVELLSGVDAFHGVVTIALETTKEQLAVEWGSQADLSYSGPNDNAKRSYGWDDLTAYHDPNDKNAISDPDRIVGGGFQVYGTFQPDFDGDVATRAVADLVLELASTVAQDTGKVKIYGKKSAGTGGGFTTEEVTLNGTNTVLTTTVWAEVFAWEIPLSSQALVTGTVSLKSNTGVVTHDTINAANTFRSGVAAVHQFWVADGKLSLSRAVGSTNTDLVIVGEKTDGTVATEYFDEVSLPVFPAVVLTANTYRKITRIAHAQDPAVVAAKVLKAAVATYNTLRKLGDYINLFQGYDEGESAPAVPDPRGFSWESKSSKPDLELKNTEYVTELFHDTQDAAVGPLSLTAQLYMTIQIVNAASGLVTFEEAAGNTNKLPAVLDDGLKFLSGAVEGTTTFADWQSALDKLLRLRVNSVVVLSPDPAVHAALEEHCTLAGGNAKSERDGFVGLMNAAMTDLASKTEIQQQVTALNSRHLRAFAQTVDRFDTKGVRKTFNPMFQGVLAAGMQAGSPVGTSLTYKFLNALALGQHSTWNPIDDAEDMIVVGLCFGETLDGVGRRWVRNITTHVSSDNLAFTEASVNEAVNYSVFNFRAGMERLVGRPGFAGTVNAGKGIAVAQLGKLVDQGVLVAWQGLTLELTLDVLEVAAEIAPVIPINFIPTTMHLVTVSQAA